MQLNNWESSSNAENGNMSETKMVLYLHTIPTQRSSWQKTLSVVHMAIKDFRLPDKMALDPEASKHKIKTYDLILKLW